jgi:uncharacterized protein VirK/YbjX
MGRLACQFIREEETGRPTLLITGIQGPGPDYKNNIVRTTRLLSGLRPKRALLEIASVLAQWSGADHFVATTKNNHVSQSKRKWQRKVVADYDNFWQELEPQTLASGDYLFPTPIPRRSEEDVAPKKRKNWRERYALIDGMAEQVRGALKDIKKKS